MLIFGRRPILLFAAFLFGVWPQIVSAQNTGVKFGTTTTVLEIELNEGQLVRLDKPASSVFIANPAIADVSVKSPRLVYVFAKAPGETTLFAVDSKENIVANIKVAVNHNLSRLNRSISGLAPAGGVTATSVDGGILLRGSVETASDSENIRRLAARFIGEKEEIINQLSVTEPNQINLRVRIAEVSRTVLNQLGLDWSAGVTGDFTFGLAATNTLAAASNFVSFSGIPLGPLDINIVVDALAEDGLITVLAEPNLTAVSGETASFLAGGEFPIPVAQDADTTTIEFKEFGVSLSFVPTIIGDNRISMHIRPEVSQLSTAGAITLGSIQIPALTVRRADTTIELGSGQSFAIAGLMLSNSEQDANKVPGLGDLPLIGSLFRNNRFERSETELVIIVTPYLVRPVNDPNLRAPTDPYVAGATGKTPMALAGTQQTIPVSPGTSSSTTKPTRPVGFIVE